MRSVGDYWKKYKNLNYDDKVVDECRNRMNEDNIHIVKQVSAVIIMIVAILMTFYILFDNKPLRNIICLGAGLFMLAIHFLSRFMLKNMDKITPLKTDILIDVFSIVCFLVAIYLGTFAAGDEMAVPSVWMFFFAILIFNRLPIQNLIVCVIASAVFFICSYVTKRPYIFRYDVMHSITSIIPALLMSWSKSQMKVQNILAMEKLESTNVEIMETVEEQEREAELLRHKASRDELTGVYKKGVFRERVKEVLINSSETSQHVLVCMDVDDFKSINDNFGHLFGDKVLKRISSILVAEVGEENLVGRFGGDEFFIFFPDTSREIVKEHMERIMSEARAPYIFKEKSVFSSLSAGISLYPSSGRTYKELFETADRELYHAKRAGKNCYSGI